MADPKIEYPCPECHGAGQIVKPFAVTREDGSVDTWEAATACAPCKGKGVIEY